MAVTFLEPGGDADFAVNSVFTTPQGFWSNVDSNIGVATDFVHGNHIKSIKPTNAAISSCISPVSSLTDTGSRISFYFYINTLGSARRTIFGLLNSTSTNLVQIKLTSGGVLQMFDGPSGVQLGSNGPTLSTGTWVRLSLAYTITSTTVNRFELFVDGSSAISLTNVTLTSISTNTLQLGSNSNENGYDGRFSDIYIDNSNSLTDTGNIWVTAKRPVSNGTTNGFTTQIGSGGSGYGTGHSPQVNERPFSTTNGWSMVGAGSAVTEEYNIESKATGDIDISAANIVDWLGWALMSSLVGETVQIILDGANNSQAITSTITLYTKIKGSSTYPSGTGADLGIITSTTLTTVSLYECGIIVAYIPRRRNFPLWI